MMENQYGQYGLKLLIVISYIFTALCDIINKSHMSWTWILYCNVMSALAHYELMSFLAAVAAEVTVFAAGLMMTETQQKNSLLRS